MIHSNYPRPQFFRQDWKSLDGPWRYSFSEKTSPTQVDWAGEICVPFPPESPLSGLQDEGYHSVIWYERRFSIPAEWAGKRIWLNFGAVDYVAQVWVNGHFVIEHEGGHTPFSADITDLLVDGEQVVMVRADDEPQDLEKPRGKQDWELNPHAIWYPRTSGIWQPVWLEPVESLHISRLRLTPDIEGFAVQAEVELDACEGAAPAGATLQVQLMRAGQVLAQETLALESCQTALRLQLPEPPDSQERADWLWTPENPVLFDLALILKKGEQLLDQVESYTGLRSVEARNGQFYLNGKPYFMQLILDQGYWQESLLAAPSSDALRKDVELTKAMGFNGARKHQKIEDPRYLYWADRLGLLVWGELPSAYKFSGVAARRLTQEFIAMIERDYNHPCIVAWVPFNESWGISDIPNSAAQRHLAETLYHLAKALDPTRLAIENDGWEHCCSDLFTIHDYENLPEVYATRYNSLEGLQAGVERDNLEHAWALEGFNYKHLPVVLSEFGGVRLGEGKGWGYVQVQTSDEFIKLFEPLMKSVYGKVLAGYCYTQLTDTFQEQNGLLYMDRTPKVDPAVVASILQAGLQSRL